MSSNTIFSSNESQKRWVLEMEKNFPKEHIVDIDFDTPTSIFRVPKTLTETNPQAYTPQHLGLGPYHHLRPELYSMQKPKLAAVKKNLDPKNPQSFQKVVDALIQFEPVLRQCYDQYLDLDIQTLAWILAIDALYLLQFLKNYSQNNTEELSVFQSQNNTEELSVFQSQNNTEELSVFQSQNNTEELSVFQSQNNTEELTVFHSQNNMEELTEDIMMFENQIPVTILKKTVFHSQNNTEELTVFQSQNNTEEPTVFQSQNNTEALTVFQSQNNTEELTVDIMMFENQIPVSILKKTVFHSQNNTEELTGDIMMLENQIPIIILKKIRQVLQLGQDEIDDWLFNHFHDFCQEQSPLKLNDQRVVMGDVSQVHMLHRMYYLIVNNRGIHDQSYPIVQIQSYAESDSRSIPISFNDVNNAVVFLDERGLPGASTARKTLSFMEKVPWGKILSLFKKGGSDEQNPSVEKIDIPPVSQMTEIAGIKFTLTSGGIRDIEFDDHGEEKKFYLPVITLSSTSEIILRNLVAFEVALAELGSLSILEFTEYVDLMCGIIDTPKDVSVLRNERIIESELSDEEITRVFNGIGKSLKKSYEKSKIEEAIDEVNKNYDNVLRVKVGRFLKKNVYASLKILSVLVSIAVLVLMVLNSYCSVFGCGRWFGRSTVSSSHNLLWSDQ